MKGGNPKPRIWDVVVTYWNFDEFIEIYIHNTMNLSTYNIFQFECFNINLPLNCPISKTTSQILGFGFPPFIYYNTVHGTRYTPVPVYTVYPGYTGTVY